jgi:hypothetical protein
MFVADDLVDLTFPHDADSYSIISSPIENAIRFLISNFSFASFMVFVVIVELPKSFFNFEDLQSFVGAGSTEKLMLCCESGEAESASSKLQVSAAELKHFAIRRGYFRRPRVFQRFNIYYKNLPPLPHFNIFSACST